MIWNAQDVVVAIQQAFPAAAYSGAVTEADGAPWSAELDDDIDLWLDLRGKDWRAISGEFIDRHASSLPLLTAQAFAAFLPAWIIRSLDRLSSDNPVLEHTVYALRPSDYAYERESTRSAMRN